MVYLDYNATTPVDARVLEKMLPYFATTYGNPASREHRFGWDALDAVEEARCHVARLVCAEPSEIIFTSGATDGVVSSLEHLTSVRGKTRVLTYTSEHTSVLEASKSIESRHIADVEIAPVDCLGRIDPNEMSDRLKTSEFDLVSVMVANNEIGTIQSIRRLADLTHAVGAIFFSDITQAVGKIQIDVRELGIDLGVFTSHKIYGPKGVGALLIRENTCTIEMLHTSTGIRREQSLRAGTLNVPGIVGFGEACRIAKLETDIDANRVGTLRDAMERALFSALPELWINGDTQRRLSNTSNIGFRGVDARTLIRDMNDIAVSAKSACSSGVPGPSHVLRSIGLTDDEAYGCIRFSLGRFTTRDEVEYTVAKVIESVRKLRKG